MNTTTYAILISLIVITLVQIKTNKSIYQRKIRFRSKQKTPFYSADEQQYRKRIYYTSCEDLYNDNDNVPNEFYVNLIKTINWTENIIASITDKSAINYGTVLRSINPDYDGKPFYTYLNGWIETVSIGFNYSILLSQIISKRVDNLIKNTNYNNLGKILLFEIDLTTHDGAPCAASDDFVDGSDIPPVDTWFYVTKKYLYCWIPTIFVEKMQAAMDVEIFDSYNWLEESNENLNKEIMKELAVFA